MIATTPPIYANAIRPHPGFMSPGSAGRNILLADAYQQGIYAAACSLSGRYRLFYAGNERESLKMLDTQSIHLIIISVERDGGKFCALLKSSLRYSHIPVILLIDRNTVRSRLENLESGADACIEGAFSGEYLNALVGNLIANRARIKDHFDHSFPAVAAVSTRKEEFLNELNRIISRHLSDTGFDVEGLARLMNMSRPTLYRKVAAVSELSPNELINAARLTEAGRLISGTGHRIFEVAKKVGFSSRSNFGKAFLNYFGVKPKEYQKQNKNS